MTPLYRYAQQIDISTYEEQRPTTTQTAHRRPRPRRGITDSARAVLRGWRCWAACGPWVSRRSCWWVDASGRPVPLGRPRSRSRPAAARARPWPSTTAPSGGTTKRAGPRRRTRSAGWCPSSRPSSWSSAPGCARRWTTSPPTCGTGGRERTQRPRRGRPGGGAGQLPGARRAAGHAGSALHGDGRHLRAHRRRPAHLRVPRARLGRGRRGGRGGPRPDPRLAAGADRADRPTRRSGWARTAGTPATAPRPGAAGRRPGPTSCSATRPRTTGWSTSCWRRRRSSTPGWCTSTPGSPSAGPPSRCGSPTSRWYAEDAVTLAGLVRGLVETAAGEWEGACRLPPSAARWSAWPAGGPAAPA
jgi:hypothetical protein